MITKAIKEAWRKQDLKKWKKTYWLIDCHSTILKPKYGGISDEFYPFCKESLQILSKQKDVCLIFWTCSKIKDIEIYLDFFSKNNIHFDYTNENPEIETGFGDYSKKLYCTVLCDDKAGFDGEIDWVDILKLVKKRYVENEK